VTRVDATWPWAHCVVRRWKIAAAEREALTYLAYLRHSTTHHHTATSYLMTKERSPRAAHLPPPMPRYLRDDI